MAEFRYQGVSANGKPMQGLVIAASKYEARQRAQQITRNYGLRVRVIQKRVPFLYKVRKLENNKVLTGEILAYSKEEVQQSLVRMGYQILYVRRSVFSFRLPVPHKEIVLFIRLCADLLREQYPYDEILSMLGNDTENRRLKETILEIQKDLKTGKEGREVFIKHERVLGKFTAYMLGLASTSGNMAEVYENTAKFLERRQDFKKSLRSILFMPSIVMLAAIGAVLFYIGYIFPEMTGLLTKYNIEIPPITAATLKFSTLVQDNILFILAAFFVPLIGGIIYFRTARGRVLMHRFIISIPVIGDLFRKSSIEVFARVFHALYSGSGENISVIRLAAEACGNAFIEKKIKDTVIPSMLSQGRGFSDSLERADVFPKNAIRNLRAGEESGVLREASQRLANYYEKETTYKLAQLIDVININISVIVSVIIVGITLLSSEIGFVSPPTGNFFR